MYLATTGGCLLPCLQAFFVFVFGVFFHAFCTFLVLLFVFVFDVFFPVPPIEHHVLLALFRFLFLFCANYSICFSPL